MMISPDEGALDRAVYFAGVLGINIGLFYKRRDYSQIVNGSNPIVAHEYLGTDLKGKDVIIIDDMISSGGSMIDTARDVRERGANRVFIFATFGLFTNGLEKFDKAYDEGLFTRVCTTNLTYQDPELLKRPYFINVDMSKYISYIIESLNHDVSISDLLDPSSKIKSLVERYNKGDLSKEDIEKLE
jgi:ribose-phosphate pyrophosphokinase